MGEEVQRADLCYFTVENNKFQEDVSNIMQIRVLRHSRLYPKLLSYKDLYLRN